MQTDYLFRGIKGFAKLRRYSYIFESKHQVIEQRIKIISFYKQYGLKATLEAFNISRRTLFRWQEIYHKNKDNLNALSPKSTRPKNTRKSSFGLEITLEIKRLRSIYPNLGTERLYYLLKPFYEERNLKLPSVSSIGRIISKDKDKMRITPTRINYLGKIKAIRKREFKNRKPKNLKTTPMNTWAMDTIEYVNNKMRRYILTMIDLDTRIAYALALSSKKTRYTRICLKALLLSLKTNNIHKEQFSILTDNGCEFKKDYEDLIKELNITHYYTYPRNPKMNAHNERFNRTLKEGFANYYKDLLFTDLREFNQEMAKWLIAYNPILPYWALNYKTPLQYALEKDSRKC